MASLAQWGNRGKWDKRWARITHGSTTTCGAPVLLIKMINWAQNEAEHGVEVQGEVLASSASQRIVLPHATCNLSLRCFCLACLLESFLPFAFAVVFIYGINIVKVPSYSPAPIPSPVCSLSAHCASRSASFLAWLIADLLAHLVSFLLLFYLLLLLLLLLRLCHTHTHT